MRMMSNARLLGMVLLVLPALGREGSSQSGHEVGAASNWSGFRGSGNSHSSAKKLPTHWSADELAWSIELPGYGQSSPVVWKEKVFVTSIDGAEKEKVIVTCLELESGKTEWIRSFPASQRDKNDRYHSRAAPTPAVDETHLFAFFESGDLFAFDHQGDVAWRRSLTEEYGDFKGNHGVGSSIAQTAEDVILLVDHEGPSYLLSVDKKTGKNRWKIDREPRVSWSSPLVISDGAGARVVISSNGVVECFEADSGHRVWFVDGLKGNTVPSPSYSDGIVVIGSSEKGSNLAIRSGGRGDVSETHVLWRSEHALSSFASPLIHQGAVYTVNRAGIARCLDLSTGTSRWSARIGASCWASPLAAGNHIYFFNKDGLTTVVAATDSDEAKTISENHLATDEPVHGIAAIDGGFVIRSGNRLLLVSGAGT